MMDFIGRIASGVGMLAMFAWIGGAISLAAAIYHGHSISDIGPTAVFTAVAFAVFWIFGKIESQVLKKMREGWDSEWDDKHFPQNSSNRIRILNEVVGSPDYQRVRGDFLNWAREHVTAGRGGRQFSDLVRRLDAEVENEKKARPEKITNNPTVKARPPINAMELFNELHLQTQRLQNVNALKEQGAALEAEKVRLIDRVVLLTKTNDPAQVQAMKDLQACFERLLNVGREWIAIDPDNQEAIQYFERIRGLHQALITELGRRDANGFIREG